jgi:hypothetical protein
VVPLPGATVTVRNPDTGALWTGPLYDRPTDGTVLGNPFYTTAQGEIEVWADAPARVQMDVAHPWYYGDLGIIDIEPDPASQASDAELASAVAAHEAKVDPHPQYLTQVEGDLAYLPKSHEPGTNPHPQYQLGSQKGQPSGYVPLDAGSLIPSQYLPPLAITDTFVVGSQAAMLALPAQRGDLCVRTDQAATYALAQDPATVFPNWVLLQGAGGAAVMSVDGRTGVVDLSDRYLQLTGGTLSGSINLRGASLQFRINDPAMDDAGVYPMLLSRTSLAFGPGASNDIPDTTLQRTGVGALGLTGSLNPNATNTRDLGTTSLRWRKLWANDADFVNVPTVGGVPIGTGQYLPLTGGTLTGKLAIMPSAALPTWSTYAAPLQLGTGTALFGNTDPGTSSLTLVDNSYLSTGGQFISTVAQPGAKVELTFGSFTVATAASISPGSVQSFNTRFSISNDGVTSLGPGGAGDALLVAGIARPNLNNLYDLGTSTQRWRKLWAVDGEFTNVPTVGGVALPTSAGIASTYLPLAGGTLTGVLTVTPPFGTTDGIVIRPWNSSGYNALQVWPQQGYTNPAFRISRLGELFWDNGTAGTYPLSIFRWDDTSIGVKGHLLAQAVGTYDLGRTDRRWRDVHLTGSLQWGTGVAAADATLQRTGAGALRVDTNLGVGVNPLAWGAGYRAAQVGVTAALWGAAATTPGFYLTSNTYFDGTTRRAVVGGPGIEVTDEGGALTIKTAPNVAAGAVQTPATRLSVGASGTLTLTPDAGQPHLQGSGGLQLFGSGGDLVANASTGRFVPINETMSLGAPSPARWSVVYAVNGTIQTSSADAKQGITPLDPAACAAAVLDTEWVRFTYLPPAAPERGAEMTDEQWGEQQAAHARLVEETAPVREQNGYVLGSPEHRVSDLFGLSDRKSATPQSDLGIVACALQDTLRRIEALEAHA